MKTSDFEYSLPEELVACYPSPRREESRLMVLERSTESIYHDIFRNIATYLKGGDLLVFNESKVIPARLIGKKMPYGGQVEVFLLRELEPHNLWKALVRPGKKIHKGDRIVFKPKVLECQILGYAGKGERIVRFDFDGDWWDVLETVGHTPLPPYIIKARKRQADMVGKPFPWESPCDRERYQAVFARVPGSVAAPTAGLHFSEALLKELQEKGFEFAFLTLHVSAGTFKPVESEKIENHKIEKEIFEIDEENCAKINQARKEGRRIVAVGTTVVRVLETIADSEGNVTPGSGETELMIVPGYRFKAIDALITNFHLPRSTLLMLVSAFAGLDFIMKAYHIAIEKKYRFYSYGDAMLIL
ncbi:tRNA preQ1(34) S-adenosylmethionine ribosyltransferase-isomerase QueA [Candidatus Sumerlaeota bacterium]|nr:tRNA preQ1(34) S-adenosylmethionine ribosyltransferase-isomerase QueA [Candidatus Sumerlaeota bacterium]